MKTYCTIILYCSMGRVEVWSINVTAMQQRYSYYFTYNYVHLYNLVWRENAGTERTQRGWRKLADIRKGEKSSWSIKNARKEHWFSKPTEKMGNVYYSSLYIWGKLKKKKKPSKASSWDYRSLQFISTLQTGANWSCLEMYNSNLACTWVNIYYPILLSR